VAQLANVFVNIRPTMVSFAGEASAGIAAARLGTAGASQGAAFGKSFGASASKLMVVGFGAGLGLLLKDSVKAAGDFQAQMVRLVTSAGETGTRVSGNLKIVSDGILAMAGPVGTTVEALGKAMYTVESGSFHGADALKVLRAAAEGAKAEGADLTKVTNAVTTALVDYHLDAGNAADVTSKLVAATAAGKTTFEGLTGALHSVLPAAAAAGISMEDVLGSLASMTLHGISAEEATQNMADAIRHLQKPTDTMSRELAILGIDARDLSAKLGERGLSGSLKLIADRVKASMPPGSEMVLLTMRTAYVGLSSAAQKLAQELIDGTISAKGFRVESMALDPVQRGLLQKFQTLANSTHQLGTQQLTGGAVMQTYSGALAAATGDAASLNVALQLTGENSENTSRAIGMVSSATAEAGGHVRGWSEITGTFNFKIAAMKAQFEALSINIGTVLLPKVGELVGKVTELLGPMTSWVKDHAELTAQIAGTVGALVGLAGGVIVISKLVAAFKGMLAVLRITAAAQWLLNAAVGTNVAITSAAELQIAAYLVWSRLAAVSTKIWAAVQWALNAAFLASPWGLIVVAIAAVVGGIVWAFFHFKAFHNFVIVAWAWMKSAGIAVWHALIVAFHAVADAAVWLWQHGIKPTFDGIMVVVGLWWAGIKLYFGLVGGVVMWLYNTIIHPYFTAMKFMINAWWVVIQIVFALVKWYIENVIAPPVLWLWRTVIGPSFKAMGESISFWWNVAKVIFSLAIGFITNTLAPIFSWLWKTVFVDSWNGMVSVLSGAWKVMRVILTSIADFVTIDIPNAFRSGVGLVGKIWDGIKSVMATPISWVIDTVINKGIIGSINTVAKALGVGTIPPVGNPFSGGGGGGGGRAPMAMADGGLLSGPGGPREDKIPILASAGEYVIPAHVVQGLGVGFFDSLIGRRKPKLAGDGSQGISVGRYADGGLVDMFMDPAKWIGGRVNGLIDKIPGAALARDLGVGTARKLVSYLLTWVKNKLGFGGGGAGGNVGAVQAWLRAQEGKPYGWAQAGPGAFDCSGIVSAAFNLLSGRNPYSHTFSTSNEAGYFPHPGMGVFTAGWANPGEKGGGRVGHTAGWLAGLPFESTGSRGVHVGAGVTPVDSFAHLGHMAAGGLVRRYDQGGAWPSGTLGVNTSGRTEHVTTGEGMDLLISEVRLLRAAVDRVAPGVGAELTGAARGMRQVARAGA